MKLMNLGQLVDQINSTPGIKATTEVAVIDGDGVEYSVAAVWRCNDTGILFIEVTV